MTSAKNEPLKISVRAFGTEKTDMADKPKRTELKMDTVSEFKLGEHKPIYYHWEDINVHTPGTNEDSIFSKLPCSKHVESKHIIKNVNGLAKPGSLMAIMGASGAGKTTLLNVANFRNRGNLKISGRVKINGCDVNSTAELSEVAGYIQQEDMFVGFLKVKEQLTFQSHLKMNRNNRTEERKARVEQVMEELNLKKCENTLIGVPIQDIKGISGGERRRLAFACELLTDPNLLFCDEPTSGLDSYMAMSIVDCMRKLADAGKTIICTIHQPSSEIFQKFDRLCLLAEGNLAYIGDSKDACKFFDSQGFPVPGQYNPSDHFINTLAVIPGNKEKSLEIIDKIHKNFHTSTYKTALDGEIKAANLLESNQSYNIELTKKIKYRSNQFTQFYWLLWRTWLSNIRSPMDSYIAIIQNIFIALLLGLIYLQITYDQQGIQNANGLLFLLLTNTSFNNMFAVINQFASEVPILLREHNNGMYSIAAYYLSKTCVEIPKYSSFTFIFITIIYWMANLNSNASAFFMCVLIVILVANTSTSFGGFISAAAPSVTVAIGLTGPVLIPLMIFSGFFLNNGSVPDYFIWIKYLSWFNYANELLQINQWDGVKNITCSPISGSTTVLQCLTDGDQVLAVANMSKSRFGEDFGALVAILCGSRILTFLILLIKSYRK